MDTVLIYRDQLLHGSETFILAQGESLTQFKPVYVGCNSVPRGIETPGDRTLLLGPGRPSRSYRARLSLAGPSRYDLTRLEKLKPVLIHAHFGLSATRAMSIASALRIPLVVTFHGWDAITPDELLLKRGLGLRVYIRQRRRLARMADQILCVSQFVRPYVLQKGFPENRTIIHYTGVDTTFFTPDSGHDREPIVLFVGRLVPEKGCSHLIEAMRRVQTVLPESELVVIGDGESRSQLQSQAAGTLNKFRFLGYQPPHVIREWMNRARVFSAPSVCTATQQETFGMVFGEAQSMGLPVASFATGGIPEVVLHGETGLLAAERDESALATNILRLSTDQLLWHRMSRAGYCLMRDRFDLRRQAVALQNIYTHTIRQWHIHNRALIEDGPPTLPQ